MTEIERGLVCLNATVPWKIGFDGNIDAYDLRCTVAHEFGYAIGLDHPSPSGVLMSYRYDERFRELQLGDVKGAVALYGMRKHRPGTPTVTTEWFEPNVCTHHGDVCRSDARVAVADAPAVNT